MELSKRMQEMWGFLYENDAKGNSCEAWDLTIAKFHPTRAEKDLLREIFDRTFSH